MQIAVLGPLAVLDDGGTAVPVAGARLRTLLIRLAVEGGRPVSTDALVAAVWADDPPAEQANALQTLVSRVRRSLGPDAIGSTPGGYRLGVDADDIDVHRFQTLAARGAAQLRSGAFADADATLSAALDLWRGPALGDAAGDALLATATRLTDLRVSARVDRLEARIALGDAGVVAEAEALAADHPLHERIAGLLLRALAANGRPADALQAYERIRARLADELGVDPSGELQQIHLTLLRGEAEGPRPPTVRRTNLKAQLTSFVGRDAEVERIRATLAQHRLVTLVGPGGAGKTRLAGEAAARLVDGAVDGVWLVELAPVTAEADVPQAVLNSIGLREISVLERRGTVSVRDAITRLQDNLAERQAVLVLDNCEHLIDACASLTDLLLAHCPDLRVLVTSREPLGIVGEALLPVPPLGQPAPTATAAQALAFPAVRLFADRAAAVRPDFVVDDATVGTVIDIVRRLDGLPLAIELAAARLRSLPLHDVAERLTDRFRLLTGGSRTALPRHRTLRAVVEWSWGLLTDDERLLVEQLAVFPSGITVGSASAVAEGDAADIADLLASLVDKSLLQPVGDGRRLRMLETIREYGAERLVERGELATIRGAHARHFAAVMAQAEPHLTRADQLPWFELLAAERENVVAALRTLCDVGDVDAAVRLGVSLSGYAMMLGLWEEIEVWLRDVVVLTGASDEGGMILARTLCALSASATGGAMGAHDDSRRQLAELARQLGDVRGPTSPWVVLVRPIVAFFADLPELRDTYLDEAFAQSDPWTRAATLMFDASLAENDGDVERQRRDILSALDIFERLGERWGLSNTLRGLAQLQTLDEQLEAAIESYQRAMRLSAELHSREDEGYIYGRLADLQLRRGNLAGAREFVDRARLAADESGTTMESVFVLAMLAAVEDASGNAEAFARLQAEALERVGELPPEHPAQGHVRAIMLASSVRLAVAAGRLADAVADARGSWSAAVGTKDMPIVASTAVSLAEIVAAQGDPERAAFMLGAAARIRGADDPTALDVVRVRSRLRPVLGDDGLAAGFARGQELDREAAMAMFEAYLTEGDQARRL